MACTSGILKILYPLCIVSTCIMYLRVQAKTPEICKIPGVLWPVIYGNYQIIIFYAIIQNQSTLLAIIQVQRHKENWQKELCQFLTDWIIEDLQPLYVVQSLSF